MALGPMYQTAVDAVGAAGQEMVDDYNAVMAIEPGDLVGLSQAQTAYGFTLSLFKKMDTVANKTAEATNDLGRSQ